MASRVNLFTNHPRGDAFSAADDFEFYWANTRGFGAGGAGTYSNVSTGPFPDGLPTPQAVASKTWTVGATTATETGFTVSGVGDQGWPVREGETYTCSAYMAATRPGIMLVARVTFYDAAGAQVGSSFFDAGVAAVWGVWHRVFTTFTVPAGVKYFSLAFDTDGNAVLWQAGDILAGAYALVERSEALGSYIDPDYHPEDPYYGQAFPEWALALVLSTSQVLWAWKHDGGVTDPEGPDPAVRLADGGWTLRWGFVDGIVPPLMHEAPTATFKLSCASAADVPVLNPGDGIGVIFGRPTDPFGWDDGIPLAGSSMRVIHADIMRITSVSQAVWDRVRRRFYVTVSISNDLATLGYQIDFDQPPPGGGTSYANRMQEVRDLPDSQGWAQAAMAAIVSLTSPIKSAVRGYAAPLALSPVHLAGQMTANEALSRSCAVEFFDDGGKHLPVVLGTQAQLPAEVQADATYFEGSPPVSNGATMYLAEWRPTTVIDAPPFELADVGGLVSSVRDTSVKLTDNTDAIIMSASLVRISPEWRRDNSGGINTLDVSGWDDIALESASTVIYGSTVVDKGTISRRVETISTMRSATAADSFLYNDHAKHLGMYTESDGATNGWAPESLEILPHLMTDDELTSYLPRFDPFNRVQQQQTLIVLDIEDDANLADGPLIATITGCEFSIKDGDLNVVPQLQPYRPAFDSPDGVTWDDFNAAPWTGTTWDDLDPTLSWDQLALTHI